MYRKFAIALVLCTATIIGLTQPAEAVLFGFREINDATCNLPGLVVDVTEEGVDGEGNVIVHFKFFLHHDTVTTRLNGVYFDDRCSGGAALMTWSGIINGTGVNFTQPANPSDPPNSQLACPPFETTDQFSADTSGGTANAVDPGEYVVIIFTLHPGVTFNDLINCITQSDSTANPCIAGLRIGVSHSSPSCGSGGINTDDPIDIGDDCNNNFIPDICDVDANGTDAEGRPCAIYGSGIGMSADVNMNGIPDECEDCSTLGCPGDGNLCTTEECVEGECVSTPFECPDGEFCDPNTGNCVECTENAQCDDGNVCNGLETCVEGVCQAGTPLVCDDGLFCNGVETCDPVAGCQPGTNPCPAGTTCNETNNTCDPPQCSVNADCDDGNLCTIDTCVEGVCVFTPVVCPLGQVCNPDTGECVDVPGPQPTPGACCLTDGSCEAFTAEACANEGGTFQGEGVACADVSCPPPPPPPQPTPCPGGGLSLLFSHLAGAPVCGMGCLMALPIMLLGLRQLRSRRRMRRRSR